MFSKVLVANRGEIASRICQTCRAMGIRTVAVYSDADVDALHVRMADEAVRIGPAPAIESYLNIDALLNAAEQTRPDAVHPGYGFLAENAGFARAVQRAGMTWIGPGPDVIALLGDKIAAKALAGETDVPVVPGYYGDDQTSERLLVEAERTGFPVMLKAAAGGGGRGMRVVRSAETFAESLEGARREALAAFGDDRMFVEKLIERPRHVEIQIMADSHGNAIYLGERDCSIQRRHQKVVEEAPSPAVNPGLRRSMGEAAVRLARAAGYQNAGTVEFLLSDASYYFLEVNTRIQVEHPVTEAVTGLDLIQLQLLIASGEELSIAQSEVQLHGHAIEARLYAEDPYQQFLPAPGTITAFRPPLGAGIRNDVGVSAGDDVGGYYDPMLAKLIAHAENRDEGVALLRYALDRYIVAGVTTNLPFLRWLVVQPPFLEGSATTDFIDRFWEPALPQEHESMVPALAACLEILQPSSEAVQNPWLQTSAWRMVGLEREFHYEIGGARYNARVETSGDYLQVSINGSDEIRFEVERDQSITVHGRKLHAQIVYRPGGIELDWDGVTYRLYFPRAYGEGADNAVNGVGEQLAAPMPARVVKVAVAEGDHVIAQQSLMVLEAMKMEHVIRAPREGTVRAILYRVGDMVPANTDVVELDTD